MIRTLIAEDSATVHALLVEILESDPEIRIVGHARHGAEAVELACRLKPDLIVMDVHMPVMGGLEATEQIMHRAPTPILIVSSSSSGRGVGLSLDATRAGALMVVAKPDDPRSNRFDERRAELLAMGKAMSRVKVVRHWAAQPRAVQPAPALPNAPGAPVRVVAIAASTGGPAALHRVFGALPRHFAVPILVVQHVAAGFVAGLAEWLCASCNLEVKVAEPGELLRAATVLLAPDGLQLGVSPGGRVVLTDLPPVNGFRPSGTHLFESAARAYGSSVVAMILTGMGNDGVDGLKAVKAAGGQVLAQDETTSVVYGMPREAVVAGVADAVLGIDEMAPRLVELVAGGNHVGARPDR